MLALIVKALAPPRGYLWLSREPRLAQGLCYNKQGTTNHKAMHKPGVMLVLRRVITIALLQQSIRLLLDFTAVCARPRAMNER